MKRWDEKLADLSKRLADLSEKAAVASEDAKEARELKNRDKGQTAQGRKRPEAV